MAITPASTSHTRCRSSALRAFVVALLLLAAALSATSLIHAQTAQGGALERAAALFAEARTAIQSGGFREASSSIPAPWGQQYVRAGMLMELARREQKAFPDQAVDDAEKAFGMFLSLPGGGPNVDLQPPVTPEKLARMGKMQAEPEAIRILRPRPCGDGRWRARSPRSGVGRRALDRVRQRASEADILGPWILEVMNAVDSQRAAVLAADHPDWEVARAVPGRTPGNAVGRSPMGGVAIPPRPPDIPPAGPAARQGAPDFERDLQAARALPEGSARVMKLLQLAESLFKNLP